MRIHLRIFSGTLDPRCTLLILIIGVSVKNLIKNLQSRLNEIKVNISETKIGVKLLPYQVKTINWLLESKKLGLPCFLTHESGLARRTQLLVYLEHSKCRSLVVVRQDDIFHWINCLNRTEICFTLDGNEACDNQSADITHLTSYESLYESDLVLSTSWTSIIFDNPPLGMDSDQITCLYNLRSDHKVILTNGMSHTLNKTELTLFASLCFGGVSRDLNYFAFGLKRSQVKEQNGTLPRSIDYRIAKCKLRSVFEWVQE